MCKRLIFLISIALLSAVVLAPAAIADTWSELASDVNVSGTVSGTYLDATDSNDVYQSITEVSDGNTSYLEHKWTIELTSYAQSVVIFIEAYHTANGEGDDFVFAYSTDDVDYTDLLTVTKTSENNSVQKAFMADWTYGTVYIRVRDADRTNGNTSLDTVYVDNIFVGCIDETWWSAVETNMWDEPNNWWSVVPDGNRVVTSNRGDYVRRCLIDSSINASCRSFTAAKNVWGAGVVYLVMTGGTLVVGPDNLELGYGQQYDSYDIWDTGEFHMSSGNVTAANDMYVGKEGYGILQMYGGNIDVDGGLYIPQDSDAIGVANLHYGIIETNSISMNSNGLLDIEKGVVVIDGNVVSQVEGYITNGWITGYNGDGWAVAHYDTVYPGQTMVFAKIGKSWNPSPADQAEDVNRLTCLSWTAGNWVDMHEIYLGTSYSDVDSATTSSSEYKGSQGVDSNSYDPCGLNLEQTYYWRVDEVNSGEPWGSPWKGNVWEFTVDHLTLEDFESYMDDGNLAATWIDGLDANNGTGSVILLGTEFFERHNGNQSMVFDFDNSNSPYYSEVYRSYVTAQDFSAGGAKKLVLFFRGTEDYNITEQMYVVLYDDGDVNTAVTYAGDANDLVQQDGEYWHVWNIDLQDFNDAGVNEKSVQKVTIGFGDRDNPSAGNAGTAYFADIRLYAHSCAADGTEYLADADFDVDEAVCFEDFRKLAIAWMSNDGEPNFGDIYDLDSNDAVTTCDLGLFSDDWLWPDNEVTITINAGSVDGNISELLSGVCMSYFFGTDDLYTDTNDPNVTSRFEDAGVKLIRYPSGGEASFFHYEYYYMPRNVDAWNPALDPNDYVDNTHQMDTNEFATIANALGAEPLITVNFQSGVKYKTLQDSVNDAVNWLTHCNVTNDFNVIYWSIENEPYYANNGDAVDVETYASYVNQFSEAMKVVDSNIKIIVNWNNELNEPNYWAEWEYLIAATGPNIDYADVHWYWYYNLGDWPTWLEQNPMEVREWCPDCYGDFDANDARYQGPPYVDELKRFYDEINDINGQSYDIKLIALEWNVGPTPDRAYSKFQQALIQSEMMA